MTQYKLSKLPPEGIYKECQQRWGVDFDEGVVFTYGDTIHAKHPLTEDLLAHELTHVRQQTGMGKDLWWREFFEDDSFRFRQELEAYRAQYEWVKKNVKDRNEQARILRHCAYCLSGEMYGNMLTFQEALAVIKADAT